MKYIANPVEVEALTIESVHPKDANGDTLLRLSNGADVTATADMTARYHPTIGDYWVVQEDGYIYLNPKDVFERKYSRPAPNALELGASLRSKERNFYDQDRGLNPRQG